MVIAILLSLLLHTGAAGSAGVVYWLAKSTPELNTTLSLIVPATNQQLTTSATVIQSESSEQPKQRPLISPQGTPQTKTVSQIRERDSQIAITSNTIESLPTPEPIELPEPIESTVATETTEATDNATTSNTVRAASTLEHMLVQNIIATASQENTAIEVTETVSSPTPSSDSSTVTRPLSAAMQLPRHTVRLETEIDGKRVYSHAIIKEKAFSTYAHFIDRWDNDVYLSKDQIIGDFHVNSRIKLASSFNEQPTIHGRLTIGVNQFLTREFQNQNAFLQGVQSGVGMIPMDREPLLSMLADIRQNETRMHYFQGDTVLQFQRDGSVKWQSIDDETVAGLIAASEQPQVIINEGRNRFELSGEINGHFLVYSPHQILITGSLNYVNPTVGELTKSSPLLGLVSRRSVEVASRFTTGSGNLRIDAAIYAARRFSVRRFDDMHQGILHIYGSLAAGSISATEPRFSTRIEKDPRLDSIRPPGFPLTGQTVLAEWDGVWLEQPTQ
ncbi:hypothetical protein [Pseudohongiella nitratireducens]|nr:hypothetical protein [Pseudohongiella nitratireducens]